MEWDSDAYEFYDVIFFVVAAAAGVTAGILLVRIFQKLIERPPTCKGFAAPGWHLVAEEFKKHVEEGHLNGGGFAVYHKGQLVVEFFGGYSDYGARVPWDETTLSCLYGCTKGIGAIVIAILVDRGLLDYFVPVVKYWPEFRSSGKDSITVEQLLSHQAGLTVLDEKCSLFDMFMKPDKMSYLLATAQPQWEPGSDHGFHTMTMGLYMDELVRRVDPKHRRLDQFFAEEVAQKFEIDCFIGLPRMENYRCAKLEYMTMDAFLDFFATHRNYVCEREDLAKTRKRERTMVDDLRETIENLKNDVSFREIPCASTHGFATVTAVAKLYGILANGGKDENNKKLMSESVVRKLNEPLVSGMDAVFCVDSTFSRGTVIMRSKDGHDIFGHPGLCGQAAFADPKHKLSWAYITNYPTMFWYADDRMYRQLVGKVYQTVTELERRCPGTGVTGLIDRLTKT